MLESQTSLLTCRPLCFWKYAAVSLNILAVIPSTCIRPWKRDKARSHPHKHGTENAEEEDEEEEGEKNKTSSGFWIIQQQLPVVYTCPEEGGMLSWVQKAEPGWNRQQQLLCICAFFFCLFSSIHWSLYLLFLLSKDAVARLVCGLGFNCHFSAKQVRSFWSFFHRRNLWIKNDWLFFKMIWL